MLQIVKKDERGRQGTKTGEIFRLEFGRHAQFLIMGERFFRVEMLTMSPSHLGMITKINIM
jgi:hypothetical protein